jgi:hypothetical protein
VVGGKVGLDADRKGDRQVGLTALPADIKLVYAPACARRTNLNLDLAGAFYDPGHCDVVNPPALLKEWGIPLLMSTAPPTAQMSDIGR